MAIEQRAIATLKPYDNNPRTHPPEQVDRLSTLIKRFGFHDSHAIAVDEDGVIIWGHGRLEAAQKAGLDTVPVEVLTGLKDEDKQALRIADNGIAEQSDWDLDKLRLELDALANVDYAMELLSLDDDLLEGFLGETPPDSDEWGAAFDKLPEGDRAPFQQMTFTLHDEQVEPVKAALDLAKTLGAFDSENENSNGNALARVCETFLNGNG